MMGDKGLLLVMLLWPSSLKSIFTLLKPSDLHRGYLVTVRKRMSMTVVVRVNTNVYPTFHNTVSKVQEADCIFSVVDSSK